MYYIITRHIPYTSFLRDTAFVLYARTSEEVDALVDDIQTNADNDTPDGEDAPTFRRATVGMETYAEAQSIVARLWSTPTP